ncbi:MAG: AAA family ATPase, partial [Bacteroidales bacterium]|nr:AAA family ATPase [Bacteroidales bacterium]
TIIIMTSNAGARFATGKGLGFGANSEKSEVMGAELKRVFAPEFLNRLTQIVAFHDMSRDMAVRILDRKVADLQNILAKKRNVSFELSPEARDFLLGEGFSAHYGAREMDRSIGKFLKPALMEALLFGPANDGDTLIVEKTTDKLIASVKN